MILLILATLLDPHMPCMTAEKGTWLWLHEDEARTNMGAESDVLAS